MAASAVPADPAQAVISGPIAQLLEANFGILNDVGAAAGCCWVLLVCTFLLPAVVAGPSQGAVWGQPAGLPGTHLPLPLPPASLHPLLLPPQFRSNMADFRVHENTALLVAFRDNILAIINQMEGMGGVMAQMPQLPVR